MKCVLCLHYEADLHMAICLPCYIAKILPLKTSRLIRYIPYDGSLA